MLALCLPRGVRACTTWGTGITGMSTGSQLASTTDLAGALDDLIAAIYGALDAQDRYQRLLDLIDQVPPERWPGMAGLLAGHLERASSLASRFGPLAPSPDPETALLARQPCAAVLLDTRGDVVGMNPAAGAILPVGFSTLTQLLPVGPSAARAREWLRQLDPQQPLCILGPLPSVSSAPVGVMQVIPGDSQRVLLRLVDLQWGDGLRAGMASAFHLTQAETSLVEALVQGLSTSEYAEQRQRSVHTVRTQLKSVLAKTGAGSQNTLIKLVVSLALLGEVTPLSSPTPVVQAVASGWQEEVVAGLHYRSLGGAAQPVLLFLHTALLGPVVPPSLVRWAQAEGWRLVVPWRPGYGGSKAVGGDLLAETAARLQQLVASLGASRLRVVGNVVGALYAHALAQRCPQQIEEVIMVAGCVPLTDPVLQGHLPPMRRLWARLASRSPQLLRPLVRLGATTALREGPLAALALAYRQPGADRAALADPTLTPLLEAGVRVVADAGPEQFVREVQLQCSDWRAVMEHPVPVHVIHGREDPIIQPAWVEAVYGRCDRARITWVDQAQQLLAYTHADAWVRAL